MRSRKCVDHALVANLQLLVVQKKLLIRLARRLFEYGDVLSLTNLGRPVAAKRSECTGKLFCLAAEKSDAATATLVPLTSGPAGSVAASLQRLVTYKQAFACSRI